MYREKNESIKLMKLNAIHKDIINSKSKYRKISDIISSCVFKILIVIKSFLHMRNVGIRKSLCVFRTFVSKKKYQDYSINYSFDHVYEIEYKTTGKIISGKVAVYTSIFGDYDTLKEPLYVSDNCDYYVITDQKVPENSVWKKKDVSLLRGFEEMDNYHKSKYCKMMPHLLFPEYDYSIWVDGNILIVADMYPMVDRVDDAHVMATFMNPLHDCVYTETNFLIFMNAVAYDSIKKQTDTYKKEGFPKHFGMREFSIIVRKHSDNILRNYMEQWWEQVNIYTMRDQISFPYILWKNGVSIDYIQLLGDNWRFNPRFLEYKHIWRHTFKK